MLSTILNIFVGDVKKVVAFLQTIEQHLIALAEKEEAKAKALFAKAEAASKNATVAKTVAGVVNTSTTPATAPVA